MFVILDENNYVKFLSTTTKMEGSIELPDDDSLNLTYLTCYKLNSEGNGLMLDAEKVAAQKDNLGALSKIFELKQQLTESDFKVLRKIREDALGIESKLSDDEYLQLEAERESMTRQIRELENGEKLVTDISEILKEGEQNREEKAKKLEEVKTVIDTTIPKIEDSIKELVSSISDGTLVQKLIEEIKKSLIGIGTSEDDSQSQTSDDEENKEETGETGSNILDGFLGLLDKINNEIIHNQDSTSTEQEEDVANSTDTSTSKTESK